MNFTEWHLSRNGTRLAADHFQFNRFVVVEKTRTPSLSNPMGMVRAWVKISFGVIAVAVCAFAQNPPADPPSSSTGPADGSAQLSRHAPPCTTPSDHIVHVRSARLVGVNKFPVAGQDAIAGMLSGQNFDSCGMASAIAYRVLDAVRGYGYFLAQVEDIAVTDLADEQDSYRQVTLAIRVAEGDVFRLGSLQFAGQSAFPMEQVRAAFPMNPGDIFDTGKLRDALDSVRSLYGRRGYLDFTPIPETEVDRRQRTIILRITLDEGEQYRLHEVRILGLDPQTTHSLMGGWTILPGKLFNSRLLENFFLENRSQLPVDATVSKNSSVALNRKDHTVDVTLDFRSSEEISQQASQSK